MALPWALHGDGKTVDSTEIVAPEERLTWPRTVGLGGQHVVAMFGATFLVPIITGFPPSTTLLFSGIGTLLFLLITKNRLPSYLGSSFAFLAPIAAATDVGGIPLALSGIIVVGALLALVGVLVHLAGTRWIDALLPPVVSGSIVALIGFNLAPAARDNFALSPGIALITLAAVVLSAVLFKGLLGRLSIFVGVVVGYVAAVIAGAVDYSAVAAAPWVGLPTFTAPAFDLGQLPIYLGFLPVVLALIAENVGHVKGVGQLTKRDLDPLTGRALFADGLSTVIAGLGGGSATTTYGENIGVMSATRVFSTAAYWVAGVVAILLGLSPKIGAVIFTIPPGVLGGVTTALYGLIGVIGIRIWVENKVDFSRPKNQLTAGVALIMGIADFTLVLGGASFGGIILGTVAAIVVFHVMSVLGRLRGTD
ncbi:uracil-xanthine permease [Frigoribacterium sp. PvP120]|jgi:NCS2 family nucleobase:cation symporter-2|uniref:uracil-xanthine permease family protein n=1 Tax=Frigoribacterium TaxID=96492 RepID=UPI0006F26A99|nr:MULTISPECIES: solute carrier family 23 protein [Frigoribacterium]KQR44465.1 nitrate reductase [Frigoribacterium sp. Leaf164]MBD8660678.1 nitrate reductase [Frigoribacterium sp. CFBP 8754]MBD8728329.1 nitrate reductase [Frigoribacterium sp. CFBP 13707]MBP1240259.1 NCS2 family nucleobase:cation symporter-2 [Frigoribacterium sp. PvP121]NII52243.1 NCS2 family nucleobase:cation symporter-2 [Frigoribacterium endophyticum]